MKNVEFEILGADLNTWETVSDMVSGVFSLLDYQKVMYNERNIELNVQSTLENYLDHAWVASNILVIENDYTIMSTPLARLINDYAIYDMVK